MVFRRRRETDETAEPPGSDGLEDSLADDGDGNSDEATTADARDDASPEVSTDPEPYAVVAPTRPNGPWDFHDVPDGDEVPRIDLGGILVPIPDGMEIRVEVQEDIPVAASLIDGSSQLQIHAFAAPKSGSLWADIRTEIAESLNTSGGSAQTVEGAFGPELQARIPTDEGVVSARFIGVDGPRWFLRGLLTGPGSTDPQQAKRLEAALRQVVVNRGTEAMAPRDMLPLHLPREALEVPRPDDDEEPDRSLQLPERGPEITEIQ